VTDLLDAMDTIRTNNVGIITKGALILTMNGTTRTFVTGEWYHVPADAEHAAREILLRQVAQTDPRKVRPLRRCPAFRTERRRQRSGAAWFRFTVFIAN
jgi:hypothetical protein